MKALGRRAGKAGLKAVARQIVGVLRLKAAGRECLREVVVDITTKVSRVVRIDGGRQPRVQQFAQIMAGQVGKHAKLQIRQRAYRQCNAVFGEAAHQQGILARLHAVVNSLHLQHIKRRPDIRGGAFFTGMRDQAKAEFAATRKHAREFLGRVAHLARIQPDADDFVAVRHGLLQRFKRFFLAQVAKKTQNQRCADAQLGLGIDAGAVQAVDDCRHDHAARRVGLRVEKNLGVDDVVNGGLAQIGQRHVVEVLAGNQHARPGVVDIQKALQIGKRIGPAQRFNIGIGQGDAVARSQ